MVHSLHIGCRRFDILVVGVYWYWVAAVYELWAARQTSPIWRASTTPQQLFGIWEQSQVSSLAFQNSVCSTLPKILQIHWTAILRWQSRHNHVRCYISSQFFICVNIVRWEGACITDRIKVYKIPYSKNMNIEPPPTPYNKSWIFDADLNLLSGHGTPTQLHSLGSNGWRTWCRWRYKYISF